MADEQFAEQFLKDWGYFYKHERDYKKAEKALLKLLEQVRGQAQAEVLASAITLFAQREPHHRAWAEPVRLLRNLQPAAKDLEALLREEWNKAIDAVADRCREHGKYQGERLSSGSDTGRTTIPFWLLGAEEDAIDSLRKEKARAEGKG